MNNDSNQSRFSALPSDSERDFYDTYFYIKGINDEIYIFKEYCRDLKNITAYYSYRNLIDEFQRRSSMMLNYHFGTMYTTHSAKREMINQTNRLIKLQYRFSFLPCSEDASLVHASMFFRLNKARLYITAYHKYFGLSIIHDHTYASR